jgi:hypothetical protein
MASPSDERKYGDIEARVGPMGPAPHPWEGSEVERRLRGGHVANWEDWYDLGTAALAGATDQTWGKYALAARSLVTALRLEHQLPAAHYHLGFAVQKLRENAGGDWRWKAWNSFTLSTRGQTETSFEGLAWFHIENGNSQEAFLAYQRGLNKLCSSAPDGDTRECRLSAEFLYRWWDALQQGCNFREWTHAERVLQNLMRDSLEAARAVWGGGHTMSMAQAMRTPISCSLRRQIAEVEWRRMAASIPEHARAHVLPVHWLFTDAFVKAQGARGRQGGDGRVRVGYLSFNFSPARNLNGLVSGLLQRHDRTRFHVTSFSIYGHHGRDSADVRVCEYVTCVCVCVVCLSFCVHTHTHTHTHRNGARLRHVQTSSWICRWLEEVADTCQMAR